jgi:hypothetical protein
MALKGKHKEKESLTKEEESDLKRSFDELKAGKYNFYKNFDEFKKEHEKTMKQKDD